MRRVVVTGLGLVSPLGCGSELAWSRLLAARSGLAALPEWAATLPARVAGIVPAKADDPDGGFDPDLVVPPKDQRRMDRFILFALVAAAEAIAQAAWTSSDAHSLERTGIGGFPAIVEAVRTTDQRGVRRLSPFTVPSFLANLAAGHISIRYGFKGPIGTPVTACAASVKAIGDAARLIRGGEADVAICGGSEACIDLVSLGGFAAARALSTGFNETPARASRPFDRDRDGFVMGEGAGILVIEELEHALRRGAQPIAEIAGYGTTADAYHITSGPEDGDGARRAMEGALRQADLKPGDIQHLNAHSTSTPVGDVSELEAIKSVFGRDGKIAVQRHQISDRSSARRSRGSGSDLYDPRITRPGRTAHPQSRKQRRGSRRRRPRLSRAQAHGDGACNFEWIRLRRRQRQHHLSTLAMKKNR